MALKRTLDSFLGSDDDSDTSMPTKKMKLSSLKSTASALYVLHIGPFNLTTSEADVRKFVFTNKDIIPKDVTLHIRNKNVFGFIGYSSLSEAQRTIYKFHDNKNRLSRTMRKKFVCELVAKNYNKHTQSLYDRSSFSHKTRWIQLFGLKATKTMNNKESKQWITRLLKWEFKQQSFDILNIKIVHNVRYPSLCGFAFIQLQNSDIAQTLVSFFQNRWINDKQFRYWLDFVDENSNDFIRNSDLCDTETSTKRLIFSNLHWKTNKSALQKHIETLSNDIEIKHISVSASANGYPLGSAIVSLKDTKHAEIVCNACNESDLFDECISVQFYMNKDEVTQEKARKKVKFDVESSESEVDSDGDDIVDMDSNDSDSDDDDSDHDSDFVGCDTESDEEEEDDDDDDSDDDDDYQSKKKQFPLSNKSLEELWRWCNPTRKRCPKGLLTEPRTRKYKKKTKDWLKEWKKREQIPGKDKYWIRSGKLVPASQKWRDRYKKKSNKVKV